MAVSLRVLRGTLGRERRHAYDGSRARGERKSHKTGETTVFENLRLFETRDGNFVRAQVYADTAAANRTTG